MPEPIEFYFDFSSPYGYLAAQGIDALAARFGRTVAWRPFLLGAVFKLTGQRPLVEVPLKRDYMRRDLARSARLIGVPFVLPTPFPFAAIAAPRAFYWLADRDEGTARALARRLYAAAFGEGRDIAPAAVVVEEAARLGVDRDALSDALQDPEVKDRLRREVETAVARQVFGSPMIIVDGEPFWGHDRFDQVATWLERGGY
jgi:2-hydroxychromene-2-carboxylate isomerase